MSMTISPQQPPHRDEFDELSRSLGEAIERSIPRAAPPPPRPPGVSAGTPPPPVVGPLSPARFTSPLQLLMEVADNAVRLKHQVELLNEAVTGEPPVVRTRAPIKLATPLLPAVAQLAHEIGVTHSEIAQLIMHLRERL
jgi:hypothetical protein